MQASEPFVASLYYYVMFTHGHKYEQKFLPRFESRIETSM